MKISDFLSPANVMVDVRAPHKRQLLLDLARATASSLNLPADAIASELLKREELGSTGTGNGIAIPHARVASVSKPFGLLARLKQPIDFDAIDARPVDIVFVLLMPAASDNGQIGALASVARKLRESESLVQLRRAKNAAELYAAITG
jgi:PTS system nitrogen regulatory IIA component